MIYRATNLSRHSQVIHGFTDQRLGFDYSKILLQLDHPHLSLAYLKQIHSNLIFEINEPPLSNQEGDGLLTFQKKIVIGIRTADCVPLLFYGKNWVAAIHAGWRGLVAGIVDQIVEIFMRKNIFPQEISVAIGPALCENCFEIGPEVQEKILKYVKDEKMFQKGKGDRVHFDLRAAAKQILKQKNILDVEILPFCTRCDNRFYSFRRGDTEGRQFSFIGVI